MPVQSNEALSSKSCNLARQVSDTSTNRGTLISSRQVWYHSLSFSPSFPQSLPVYAHRQIIIQKTGDRTQPGG